jgi:hypothetical protein
MCPAARNAENRRVVFTDSADTYPGWPFFLPDNKALVFARGVNSMFSGQWRGCAPGPCGWGATQRSLHRRHREWHIHELRFLSQIRASQREPNQAGTSRAQCSQITHAAAPARALETPRGWGARRTRPSHRGCAGCGFLLSGFGARLHHRTLQNVRVRAVSHSRLSDSGATWADRSISVAKSIYAVPG